MLQYSLLLIATTAGLVLASDHGPAATLLVRQDAAATAVETAAPHITLQQKAVQPTCITEVIPASSSCNIGVHSEISDSTLEGRAVPATCQTFWTTQTNCKIGVHPQPTDLTVTVTENTQGPDGTTVATTITTAAQASISAPASGDSGSIGFVLTPSLRTEIVNVINAACPKKLKARDGEEIVDLACALPQSVYDGVRVQIENLIRNTLAYDPKAVASLFGGVVTEEQIRYGLTTLFAMTVLSQAVGNGKLALSSEMSADLYKPILQNPPQGGGGTITTTTSSSGKPAPTGIEAHPNFGTIPSDPDYTKVLTEYLGGSKTTATPICTYGASPNKLKNGGGYCQCEGKMYPTSISKYVSTISGTATTLNEPCPYTEVPSSTFNVNDNTIVVTMPSPTKTGKSVPTQMCLPGAPAYKPDAVISKASVFCASASDAHWAAATPMSLVPANPFPSKVTTNP